MDARACSTCRPAKASTWRSSVASPGWRSAITSATFRSRISVNVDLPLSALELLRLTMHETYPGHHAERCSKEAVLVRDRGLLEETLVLVPTPQSLVSEGIAKLAPSMVLESEPREHARSDPARWRDRPRSRTRTRRRAGGRAALVGDRQRGAAAPRRRCERRRGARVPRALGADDTGAGSAPDPLPERADLAHVRDHVRGRARALRRVRGGRAGGLRPPPDRAGSGARSARRTDRRLALRPNGTQTDAHEREPLREHGRSGAPAPRGSRGHAGTCISPWRSASPAARRRGRTAPRTTHGAWKPAARPARPDRAPRGAGREPGARARPDPLRTDARVAVRVLPRRGARHGRGPGGDATLGHQRPALRRRPSVELRPLRLPRAPDPVRHQRLRRDASRPVGMGCEAPRRERRGARPRARLLPLRPARHGHGRRARVPAGDAARGATSGRSRPGTTTWTSSR